MSFVVTAATREIDQAGALEPRPGGKFGCPANCIGDDPSGIGLVFLSSGLWSLVQSQLYEVRPSDPAVIAITVLFSVRRAWRRTDSAHRASCVTDGRIKSRVAWLVSPTRTPVSFSVISATHLLRENLFF